ncbi:Putative peptidoglycan binding domain-containing protein [Brevibacterium sp. Mu109]|uniref:peptidoglycan-binding domain-containing protein n=1 Tax=Brevibacterium sp. Mu109 TaxID=1255669 RepID=UPI000C3CA140|nr:peptidoglycan-binding domain-containing protein [Brevibacterium sp. Mu109]SMX92998.1 Putative peptidoglycan binding domain-containing protein [Brevibacterium sp. Mu109]
MSAKTAPRKTLRVLLTTVVIAALAASGVAVAIWKPWESNAATSGVPEPAAAVTVPVELGTLTSQLRLNATLGYGEPVKLPAAQGVLTALPAPGQVIEVGQQVYEADGRPVVLLEGARPFWRDLSSDATDGQDVLQLEQNLARLGFFDREPDTRFDWWTTEAVRRWQKELGIPVTGTVAVADVVVVNAPSIRVSQVTGELGQTGVSPATYTATTLTAIAKLTPAQARELIAGTPVTVVLPDGTELENTIAAVDPGGQPTGEDGQTTPPTAMIEFPDQEQVAATGPASVRVIVQNTEESAETLIVPATALIATASDSYAVEVLTGDRIVRVPVQIGLVGDARVQILASGPDVDGAPADAHALSEGDQVVISR